MGYRNYIGRISKEEYEKIKDYSPEELCLYHTGKKADEDGYNYVSNYDIVDTSLYGLGKYVDSFPASLKTDFFTDPNLQGMYDESELMIVNREFFEVIIAHYAEKVREFYKSMITPFLGEHRHSRSEFLKSVKQDGFLNGDYAYEFDFSKITKEEQHQLYKVIEHVLDMGKEWGVNNYFPESLPYDLNAERPEITTSWKYEYVQFELIRIYKAFDWEKDLLVYYGW